MTTTHDATTPTRPETPFSPRYRAVMIGMLTLISAGAFEGMAVTTVMPVVVADIGGLGLYAMAFAAPVAAGVVGMVTAGRLTDRRGPTLPVLLGTVLFAVGLVVAGLAPAMETIVVGRLVHGLGAGMFTVALYVVVARVFPDRLQAKVFAAFAAAWVLPAIIGPSIGGIVAREVGWRWVFLAVPLICVAAVVALRPVLRGLPDPGSAPDDAAAPARRGAVLAAVAAGSGALALHWAGQRLADHVTAPDDAVPTLAGIPAAAVLGTAVGLTLLAVAVPRLLPRGTWRAARGLPTVVLLRGVVAAAFFGAEVYLPLLLQNERGYHPAQAGIALTLAAIAWSLGSWLRGRRTSDDDRPVLVAGAALVAVGIGSAALAVVPGMPLAVTAAGWAFGGLGMGLTYPTLSLLTLRLSPVAEQGRNTSALQVNEALTTAATLAVLGAVFVVLHDDAVAPAYLTPFALTAGLALLGAAIAPRVGRPGGSEA